MNRRQSPTQSSSQSAKPDTAWHWVLLCHMFLGLVLIVASHSSHAAQFANNYGLASATTQITAVAKDAAGNVYVAGFFDGATLPVGSTTLTRIGDRDVFVAKLNSTGTAVWAKNFGGSGATATMLGQGVAVDSSGNVLIAGYFQFANLTTPALTKIGSADAFAIKLDSGGNTTWAKNFGGSGASAFAYAIAVDSSGNALLGGDFNNANLTTPALTKIGNRDSFAIKLASADGSTSWSKNFGGTGASTYGTGIAVDGSGNTLLGGYFNSANLTTPALTIIGSNDTYAIKLASADGSTTWAKNFGGSGASAFGQAITVDASNNVLLGGELQSANLTTPALTRIGSRDAFALKLNGASGTTTWAKNFGGSGATTNVNGITVDSSGNALLGGNFTSANLTSPALTRIGSTDAFAIKLASADGGASAAKNFGGAGANAYGNGIAVDASGDALLGGYFTSANLTTPALTNIGSQDAFILRSTLPSFTTTVTSSAASANVGTSTTLTATVNNAAATGTVNFKVGNTSITGCSARTVTAGVATCTTSSLNADINSITAIYSGDATYATSTSASFAQTTVATSLPIFANNYGFGGASTLIKAIVKDAAGNTYIAGNMQSDISIGSVALLLINNQDGFVAKLDNTGATKWAINFNGGGAADNTSPEGIAVDANGNVLVTGNFEGSDLFSGALTKIGTRDAFVAKFSGVDGSRLWAKNFGGTGADTYGSGIAVDSSGNVLIAGYFANAHLSAPVLNIIGDQDAFAIKLASGDGTTLWSKNFGGSGAGATGQAIAVDASNNVLLGGFFQLANLTTPVLNKIGARDAFAIKLAGNDGSTSWSKNFGGSGAQTFGRSIATDASSNVLLSGDFVSANLTTPTLTKIGSRDAFTIKLASSDGSTTWSKGFGGSGASAYGPAIAVDSSNNVLLGGYFQSANLTTPVLNRIGTQDAFVIKLASADGGITASTNIGGSGAGVITYGVAVDINGNVLLGGAFTSASLTRPVLSKIGTTDALILRTSFTTTTLTSSSASANVGTSITLTATISPTAATGTVNFKDGSTSITGCSAQTVTAGVATCTTSALTADIHSITAVYSGDANYATSTSASFRQLTVATSLPAFANGYGLASSSAQVNAVSKDAAGNIYIAGTFDGATLAIGGTTLTRIGAQDAFVAKLNSAGTAVWAKNFGGSGASAEGKGVAVDSSGNVVVAGFFNDANLTTPALTKIGNRDAFAIKLASDGSTVWSKNFGGSGGAYVYGNAIAVDSSGNVLLGGAFDNANLTTPVLSRIGGFDTFVFKLASADGSTTWVKNFGGSGANAFGNGIAVDSGDNVLIAGYLENASFTTPALTKLGDRDAFVFKLASATGNTTWFKGFGVSSANVYGKAVAVDSGDNVLLSGYFDTASLTTPTLSLIGATDAFVIKLASNGNTTWAKNVGGSGANAYGTSVAVDGSNNVLLGGYFDSANLTTPALSRIGATDAFAIKLASADGSSIDAKNFGGSGASVNGYALAADANGNVLLGGNFTSANLTTPSLNKIGNTDALILRSLLPSGTTTVVTSSAATANFGTSITLTATVSNAAATGTVDFKDGGTSISGCAAQAVTAGVATCTVSSLSTAAHSITAVYSGDANYATSTSTSFTQTITAAVTPPIPTPTTPPTTNPGTGFVVEVPADKPQTKVTDVTTVIQGAPTGTLLSDNGVVVLPKPSGTGSTAPPITLAANAQSNAVIQLPSGSPTSFSLNGQTFTFTPIDSGKPVQVQTKTFTVTDSSGTRTVTSLQVTQGSATLTGTSGQIMTAFAPDPNKGCGQEVGYVKPLSSDTQVLVDTSNASFLLTGHINSGSAIIRFPACATAANAFAAASALEVVMYRGEQAYVGKSAQIVTLLVRSATGTVGDAGDALNLKGLDGFSYASSVFVPQLAKDTGRLPVGSTLQSLVRAASLQTYRNQPTTWTFQGQDSNGIIRMQLANKEIITAIPVGPIEVKPGQTDRVGFNSYGQAQLTVNENVITFNAGPRDPARLVSDLRLADPVAQVQVVDDGTLRVSLGARLFAAQGNWTSVYDAAATQRTDFDAPTSDRPQVCHQADGWRQCYYPVVNDFITMGNVLRSVDPAGTLQSDGGGFVTLTLKGSTFTLLPDWEVIKTPSIYSQQAWWVEAGKIYLTNPNGLSQGFTVR